MSPNNFMLCHTSLFIFSLCPHVTFYKTLTSLSTVFVKGHIAFLQLLKWLRHTSFFTHVETNILSILWNIWILLLKPTHIRWAIYTILGWVVSGGGLTIGIQSFRHTVVSSRLFLCDELTGGWWGRGFVIDLGINDWPPQTCLFRILLP